MRSRLAVALCLAALPCAPARALDCKDGGATQSDMNECATQSFKAAYAELNERYARLSACIGKSSDGGRKLVEAQRAWLRFRDAECGFQGGGGKDGGEDGSARPMVVAACLGSLTRDRSRELDAYLSCREGDLSCPAPGCGSGRKPSPRP